MANMERYQCIDLEGVVVAYGAEFDYGRMSTWTVPKGLRVKDETLWEATSVTFTRGTATRPTMCEECGLATSETTMADRFRLRDFFIRMLEEGWYTVIAVIGLVDDEGDHEGPSGDRTPSPDSNAAGGIGEAPVSTGPVPVPARSRDKSSRESLEEHIPGPKTAITAGGQVGHHVSALESLLVKKNDRESSGSDSSTRKPPPSKLARLEAPGFGGPNRRGGGPEFFDIDPDFSVKKEDNDDELKSAAPPVLTTGLRSRRERERERATPYDQETPPWVAALEGRLLTQLEPIKQDVSDMNVRHLDMHREMVHFTSELQSHKVRLDTHDAVLKEHTERGEAHHLRISALEREVRDLRAASRSPTPQRAPPSPRGSSPRSERNIDEELQLAIGGWEDARRDEAVEEAKAFFEAMQLEKSWLDIWSPYSRTSHVRVTLQFPDNCKNVPQQRAFQTQVLDKLKSKKFLSNIPGQECRELWVQRHRTPEDRAKIRAIVSVKEFIEQLTFAQGFTKRLAEIDWRGKLFVGNINVLGSPDSADPLQDDDFPLSDARGNHSGWYIKGAAFTKATGLTSESLPERWETRITKRP
ncbi:unnamed protein product [Symbiodinium sp. CCMP2592]|nr:unnamed protein product [Symbiodinium sp. CCMP2592]